jgi:hypothetical protein
MIVAVVGDNAEFILDLRRETRCWLVTVKGVRPMGKALPKSALDRKTKPAPFRQHIEKPEMQALEEENARLRELVTQLSEIVIKNIVDNIEDG